MSDARLTLKVTERCLAREKVKRLARHGNLLVSEGKHAAYRHCSPSGSHGGLEESPSGWSLRYHGHGITKALPRSHTSR